MASANFTWIFVVANHKSDKRSWFIILFFTNQSKSFWVLKLCRLLNRNFLLAQGKKENLPWAQFHHSWHKIIFLSTQELDIEIFVVSQWILYKGYYHQVRTNKWKYESFQIDPFPSKFWIQKNFPFKQGSRNASYIFACFISAVRFQKSEKYRGDGKMKHASE